jgi:hypothetical protein
MLLFKTPPNTGTAPSPRSNATVQNPTKSWNRSTSQEHCCYSKPHQQLEPLQLPGGKLLFKSTPTAGTSPTPRRNTTVQNPTRKWNRSTSQEQQDCSKARQKTQPLQLPGAMLLFKSQPTTGTAPPPRSTAGFWVAFCYEFLDGSQQGGNCVLYFTLSC